MLPFSCITFNVLLICLHLKFPTIWYLWIQYSSIRGGISLTYWPLEHVGGQSGVGVFTIRYNETNVPHQVFMMTSWPYTCINNTVNHLLHSNWVWFLYPVQITFIPNTAIQYIPLKNTYDIFPGMRQDHFYFFTYTILKSILTASKTCACLLTVSHAIPDVRRMLG